jgi:hypothetical protein
MYPFASPLISASAEVNMGVWGTGLYSGDFAIDLRNSISAVLRLPFDQDRLIDILCETEPEAANNPADSDHSVFWLVLADQFAKRAIMTPSLRQKALSIIDTTSDITTRQALGASAADLRKRRKMLDELRGRITEPPPASKKRPILEKPQPLLMEIGDVFAYPTAAGRCINPYVAPEKRHKYKWAAWNPDGWSACVIVDSGRAFDFLSWYRPLTISIATGIKPDLAALRGELSWKLNHPGTCPAVHLKRLEFEKLGRFALDRERVRIAFPGMRPGTHAAINDISIANRLHVASALSEQPMPKSGNVIDHTIRGIGEILAS